MRENKKMRDYSKNILKQKGKYIKDVKNQKEKRTFFPRY